MTNYSRTSNTSSELQNTSPTRRSARRRHAATAAALALALGATPACGDDKVPSNDVSATDTGITEDVPEDLTPDTDPLPDVAPDADPAEVQAETTPSWPAVVLNEVAPAGDPTDWLELYNPTATPADLSGWMLTDSDPLHVYTLPAGTTIAAGGWLVVENGTEGFDFGLGSGDSAVLLAPDGSIIDETSWTPETLPRAANHGRFPNGSGPFMPLYIATRGEANVENPDTVCGDETIASPEVCDTNEFGDDSCEARGWAGGTLSCEDGCMRIDTTNCVAREAGLVINEVTSSGDDRIELFNGSGATVDLAGWSVSDEGGGVWVIPDATTIEAGGYLVFVKDVHHTFGLGGSDSVTLKDPSDAVIDTVAWGDGAAAVSYCRRPNGVGGFEACPSASFGGENF